MTIVSLPALTVFTFAASAATLPDDTLLSLPAAALLSSLFLPPQAISAMPISPIAAATATFFNFIFFPSCIQFSFSLAPLYGLSRKRQAIFVKIIYKTYFYAF